MRTTIDVPGVGQFALEPGGVSYRHYVCLIAQEHAPPAMVITYLDGDDIGAEYVQHVRRVVGTVLPNPALVMHAARTKILALMSSYGLDVPEQYGVFADSLQLTHVKPTPDGLAELIFGTCRWFPNFDLTVALDRELAITKVSFGG